MGATTPRKDPPDPPSVADTREQCIAHWLDQILGGDIALTPLAGDASFRRYLRARRTDGESETRWVVMDAPPERESVGQFLKVQAWLEEIGIRVPEVVAADVMQGLVLLEDFGDTTWAVAMQHGQAVEPLFEDALQQLRSLQRGDAGGLNLPHFDQSRMARECALYLDWYLPYIAKREVDATLRGDFFAALQPLFTQLSAIPQAPVHLDYHSRNLMMPNNALPLGVIDFQDACIGPITYDLASLLYDCYQDYDPEQSLAISRGFYEGLPAPLQHAFTDRDGWHEALLATALQRHIKVCGIFARLAFRDGKTQFLHELPQTRRHLLSELEQLNIPSPLSSILTM